METGTVLATVDVAAFGVLTGWFAFRTVVGVGIVDRLSNAAHLLMAAVMVAMPWMLVPSGPQIVVFTAAALWYGGLVLFRPQAEGDLGGHAGHSRLGLSYHATMMVSMVWMAVAMQPDIPTAHGTSMDGMAGMSGMSGMSGTSGTGGMSAMDGSAFGLRPALHGAMSGLTGSAAWAAVISVSGGLFFAGAAVVLLIGVVRRAVQPVIDPRRLLDWVASSLMAAGMSYAFLVLMI